MNNDRDDLAGLAILVTGGTGFIGRRLVAKLMQAGARVTLLHRGRSAVPAGCGSIVVEHWDPTRLAGALRGAECDGVFNLAAYGVLPTERDPATMHNINVVCARELLGFASRANARFFLHTGSCAEYAEKQDAEPLKETSPAETTKVYGVSKAKAADLLVADARKAGLRCVVARLFGVYGPGEASHRLLPALRSKLSRGQRVPLSHGMQVRDFLHVDDACDGLIACVATGDKNPISGIVNMCSGSGVSVKSFALTVARHMKVEQSLLGFGDEPLRAGEVMNLVGSTDKLNACVSWRPRYSLAEGIEASLVELSRQESLSDG